MGIFGKKKNVEDQVAKQKIGQSTKRVLDLEAQMHKLELQKDQLELELQNMKQKGRMKIDEEIHQHKLELQTKTAVFDREKAIWEKEKQELIEKHAEDKEKFENDLKAKFELDKTETVTLIKLESQQKIKQAEIDKERAINRLEKEKAEELSEIKSKYAEEYYEKLTKAFEEIQLNGDHNSKFIKDIALAMIDKSATTRDSKLGVDVNVGSNVKRLESVVNE